MTIRALVIMAIVAVCQFSPLTTSANAATTPVTYSATASSKDGGVSFETTFKFSRNITAQYLFDVEVWNANNQRVYQSNGTTWVKNTNTKVMVRPVPTGLAAGTYRVKAGIYTPNWVTNLLWLDNAGLFNVGSPTSTTTTTAPTTTTTTAPTTTTTAPPTTTSTTAAPTTTTTTAPTTNDLNGWKYTFGDSFDTNASEGNFLSTYKNWGAYGTGWSDTSRRGMYDQNIISASNGLMNIRLHTGADGKPRAAVPFPLINGSGAGIDQLYGRYEVRFRADEIDGYKTAFLLWPQSETWPRDGEIDFAEGDLNGTIGGFVHHQGGTYGGDQDGYSTSARYSPWHTATIEWSPTSVKFILDGQVIGNSTTRVPNTPMHWVLQTETCLDGCAIPANVSGNVQFDYVKVWKYDPTVVVN